jgi:hypothetical protein
LYTCADIIRSNAALQTTFALHQIPVQSEPDAAQVNGKVNGTTTVYIIDALLDTVIASPSATFNVRLAASETIKAYFVGHDQIRHHFLQRAIDGHTSGEDETANILSTVIREGASQVRDPHRIWFASVLLFHLIWADSQAKDMLMKVVDGDAESGEEVVTCIQTIAGNMVSGLQRDDDEKIQIGYMTLIVGWLFEDAAAVDDFLGEGSFIQSLMQPIVTNTSNSVIRGLCALLLGIIYEYSTKDSPIPRRKLHPILTSTMGRERYLQALSQLRQHPLIRDYEVYSQDGASAMQSAELPPYAYFDATFIEFLKDNFSRFSRAIDRDPGIEIQPSTGEAGIDRDLVDTLRSQLDEKNTALQQAENRILELEQRLDSELANRRKDQENANSELQRIKQVNEGLQKSHESQIAGLAATHAADTQNMQQASSQQLAELQQQLQALKNSTTDEAARTKDYYERSLSQVRTSKSNLDQRLEKAQQSVDQLKKELEETKKTTADLQSENTSWKRGMDTLKSASQRKDQQIADIKASLKLQTEVAEDEKTKVSLLEKEVSDLESQIKDAVEKTQKAEAEAKEKEEARGAVQTELDDLLMVLGDIEEKRTRDKVSKL